MNLKKMLVLALLFTLGSGMGFASDLTKAVQRGVSSAIKVNDCRTLKDKNKVADCEKYLKTIQNNEYLEFFLPSGGYDHSGIPPEYKKILTKAAEKSVQQYANYAAYRNAAIVYVADDTYADPLWDFITLQFKNANKAKKYATNAINIAEAQSVPAPEMYFVRALAAVHEYGLIDYGTISHSQARAVTYSKVLEQYILPDLEKVGKMAPDYAPWYWMEFMYNALDRQTDAARCHKMMGIYGTVDM